VRKVREEVVEAAGQKDRAESGGKADREQTVDEEGKKRACTINIYAWGDEKSVAIKAQGVR
jgi:hypothetical protein